MVSDITSLVGTNTELAQSLHGLPPYSKLACYFIV
jgi:hypothetical protein